MEPSSQDQRLGRIALENELVSHQQLSECIAEQAESEDPPPLGLLLIRKGYLDDQQLKVLSGHIERELENDLERQAEAVQDILLATLVVQRGLLTSIQLRDCLDLRQAGDEEVQQMRLGQLMLRERLISSSLLLELLREKSTQEFPCEGCASPFEMGKIKPGAMVTCQQCGALTRVPTMDQVLALLRSGEHIVGRPGAGGGGKKRSKRKKKAAKQELPQATPPDDELDDVPALDIGSDSFTPSDEQLRPTRVDAVDSAPEGSGPARIQQMLNQGSNKVGTYEVLEEIATGGMGIVFKARQEGLNRIVALKILKDRVEANDEQVQRFQREARAASRMNHQNIVSIIEVGNADGLHYLVMDYLEGIPLDEIIEDDGRIEPKRGMRLMEQITDAIAYAHSCNVVHRDLKPSNVIVDPDDQPHITDFGLAKRLDSKSKLTETGALVGTPYYMAPEQILEGSQGVKKSWDVYALGVLLYEMLTGQLPFKGETTMEVYHQILNEDPRPPRQLVRSIPPAVERICMKALMRDEAARYRSVAELHGDVVAYLEGRQVSARPPGWFGRLKRRYEMNTVLYTIIACAMVIIVGIVCILVIRQVKRSHPRSELQHSRPVVGERGLLDCNTRWRST